MVEFLRHAVSVVTRGVACAVLLPACDGKNRGFAVNAVLLKKRKERKGVARLAM